MAEYKPAIVVVAYKRTDTLSRLLQCIAGGFYRDSDIPLIISIDYCDDNRDVIKCAEQFRWDYGKKIIKTHTKNLGLRRHIMECGEYAVLYGSVIILEDDLIVAPNYYEYVKTAHRFYGDEERVAGISLYSHEWNGYAKKRFMPLQVDGDVYFGQFSCTWGESWNKRQWREFKNWYDSSPDIIDDGSMPRQIYRWNQSWGKYFAEYIVKHDLYYVMPYKALSTTVGAAGVHSLQETLDTQVGLHLGKQEYRYIPFDEGAHYNIFFENVDLKKKLCGIVGSSDICIDLYGTKALDLQQNRYILSTRKLDYKIVKRYALQLRPHDMNVVQEMPGEDIFLYDRKQHEKNKAYRKRGRIMYDLAGYNPRETLLYSVERYFDKYLRRRKRA